MARIARSPAASIDTWMPSTCMYPVQSAAKKTVPGGGLSQAKGNGRRRSHLCVGRQQRSPLSRSFVLFKRRKDPKSKLGRTAALSQLDEAVKVVAAVMSNTYRKRFRKARTHELGAPPGEDLVRLPVVGSLVLDQVHVSPLLILDCLQRRGPTPRCL
jgi:hypothetical protein